MESNNSERITDTPLSRNINQVILDFLQDLAVGHSPATTRTYRIALNRYCQYLILAGFAQPEQDSISILKTDWAVSFLRTLAVGQANNINPSFDSSNNQTQNNSVNPLTKVSKSTLSTYSAALLRFYSWCGIEQLLHLSTDEYARLTKRLKELRGKQQRTILNKVPADEIIEKLLAQARRSYSANNLASSQEVQVSQLVSVSTEYDKGRHKLLRLRNIALLETLKSTGARVSEICGLTRADLDNTNQRARVVGKGSKERWVYFSAVAWTALDEYLAARAVPLATRTSSTNSDVSNKESNPIRPVRRRERASEVDSQPLFARHDRGAGVKQLKPLAPRSIENMLWQLVEEAGLQTYITPHKFRHWFATRILAATGDLATTQDLLGHASPTTTRIYAQVSEQKKQNAHRQVFN